ncbi:MAG: SusD/RagB family nutrient-binding outer membrane lipoprotein [Cellulophaga sp.]
MKKYITMLKYVCCFSILLSILSCADDELFRETNTNKEGFATLDANLLLTTVQASISGGRREQWRTNLVYGEGIVQHLGGSWAASEYGAFYKHNEDYESALWTTNYGDGIVRDLIDIQERTKDKEEFTNLNAIAKIIKVMVFQRLTDTYGNVPFSEAGLGFYQNIYLPKYDNQQEIYTQFFILLEEAFQQLNENADEVTGDNFYGGDIAQWKKMANALRVRCAMRISMVDEAKAITEINAAISNGLFESNADNCFGHHDNTPFNISGAEKSGNGFSQALKGAGAIYDHPTEIILSKLTNDPRKELWFLPGATGVIEGVSANNFRWDHPGGSGNLGVIQPIISNNDSPYLHLSYSEVQLLLAEASQRNLIVGNVQEHYQKGIEAGILQWTSYGATVDASAATAFAASKTLTPGNEIEEIATQQWLTLFTNGMEAYANLRRVNFPILDAVTRLDSQTNGVMPNRLGYPVEESTVNKKNYETANAQYPEGWLSRVWWDIN